MNNSKTKDKPEDGGQGSKVKKPTLTINVYSWGTLIFGVLMLLVGMLAGFLVHPYIPLGGSSTTEAAAAATPNPGADSQTVAESPDAAASQEEMMDFLVSQTRHLKGDPEASVIVLEFSDFK